LPVFYVHAGFGGAPAAPEQARFLSDPESFARLLEASAAKLPEDGVIGIAPHSLRAVAPKELDAILPLAGEGPIHVHAAEQRREVDECMAELGARPVEWLLANAPVDRRWCLVHATHLSPSERDGLAASGAVAALCPVTEANLGDGTFPAANYLEAGGVIAIGSDSNVRIDAAEELRTLEYGQRLKAERRTVLGSDGQSVGRALFDAALAGGAQATGIACGLVAGQSADLVSLDAEHPSLAEREEDALLDGWIFAAGKEAVDCVWRAGRKVVTSGRHHNRSAIQSCYKASLRRVLG